MDLMLFYCLYAMPPVVEYIYINKDWSRNQTVNTLNVEKLPSTKYNTIFFLNIFENFDRKKINVKMKMHTI